MEQEDIKREAGKESEKRKGKMCTQAGTPTTFSIYRVSEKKKDRNLSSSIRERVIWLSSYDSRAKNEDIERETNPTI